MIEKIVLILTKHPLWGIVLQPVLVQENEYGTMTILEYADSKSSGFAHLNDMSKEIVMLSECMSDSILMGKFSKEKTIAAFHKKVKPEIIENSIRPYIEEIQRRMVLLLVESGLPLFIRENAKVRNLYASDLAIVPETSPSVTYHFTKDAEEETACIRYSIQVESQDEELELYYQPFHVLSSEPATLVVNSRLLIFEETDIKKLKPFFTKREIEIPLSYENTYIKTFIRNCLENSKVVTTGIDVQEISPEKKATMDLETDTNNMPVLKVSIHYGDCEYPLDSECKKIVQTVENDGKTSLTWFYPDKEWEKSLIAKLMRGGMEKVGPQHFTPKKNKAEYLVGNQVKNMVEWISKHKEVMKNFEFNEELPD